MPKARVGGRFTPAVEVEDRVEDDLVRRPVEVVAVQHLDDVGDRVLAQQHAAEHRLFRRDVLRRLTVVLGRRRRRPAEIVGDCHAGPLHLLTCAPANRPRPGAGVWWGKHQYAFTHYSNVCSR